MVLRRHYHWQFTISRRTAKSFTMQIQNSSRVLRFQFTSAIGKHGVAVNTSVLRAADTTRRHHPIPDSTLPRVTRVCLFVMPFDYPHLNLFFSHQLIAANRHPLIRYFIQTYSVYFVVQITNFDMTKEYVCAHVFRDKW